MLAVVRAPRTKRTTLEIRGQIPKWMLSRLKKEYKDNLIVKETDDSPKDDDLVNIFESDWFSSIDSKMTPGENLRIYRENAGFSQTELGEKLGKVPRQNISSMEKGKRGISKDIAKKLSQILNAPISRFI